MKRILLKYMTKFTSLNEEQQQAVTEGVLIEEYKKGAYLLRQGDLPAIKCYFVLKGCIRQFLIDETGNLGITPESLSRIKKRITKDKF
jgi:CRP-like cAMP-binding protein